MSTVRMWARERVPLLIAAALLGTAIVILIIVSVVRGPRPNGNGATPPAFMAAEFGSGMSMAAIVRGHGRQSTQMNTQISPYVGRL